MALPRFGYYFSCSSATGMHPAFVSEKIVRRRIASADEASEDASPGWPDGCALGDCRVQFGMLSSCCSTWSRLALAAR